MKSCQDLNVSGDVSDATAQRFINFEKFTVCPMYKIRSVANDPMASRLSHNTFNTQWLNYAAHRGCFIVSNIRIAACMRRVIRRKIVFNGTVSIEGSSTEGVAIVEFSGSRTKQAVQSAVS